MVDFALPRQWLSQNHAFFLVFEGIDGSGKSTQARLLFNHFKKGTAFLFKEPTTGPTGKLIRELSLQNPQNRDAQIELDLFIEDRIWDLRENILPALKKGWVILDRYILSNVAYQGALGKNPQEILEANSHFPWPDLTFFLDIPVPLALERINSRGELDGFYEQEAYLRKVKQIYENLSCTGLVHLDGTLSVEQIFNKVLEVLLEFTAAPRV
jgi:dTMP kinase